MRDTAGSAAAPAARCRKFRRGSFILNPPSLAVLFDHLVGGDEQLVRHGEAEHLGGLPGGSCHTARAYPICTDARPSTCTRFCKALGPPTCPWNSRPSSTWLSTSRP